MRVRVLKCIATIDKASTASSTYGTFALRCRTLTGGLMDVIEGESLVSIKNRPRRVSVDNLSRT